MAALKRWYVNRLLHQRYLVGIKINHVLEMLRDTQMKEYTQGWLHHLDVELDYLTKRKASLDAAIDKYAC